MVGDQSGVPEPVARVAGGPARRAVRGPHPTPMPAPTQRGRAALLGRRDEVAEWAHQQLSGEFLPTLEEIVSVSKARHGVRPVAM